MDALKITGTGQILLGVCWTHDDARRKFDLSPSLVPVTAEEQTQKKGTSTGPQGQDVIDHFVHTLGIPAIQCHWVFD
jgi:hypothetical protein